MRIFCIDIGNTRTHFGLGDGRGGFTGRGDVETRRLGGRDGALAEALRRLVADGAVAVAFCSVVPEAAEALRRLVADEAPAAPVFQLTHESAPDIAPGYPRPSEIGQDRLANAAAVRALGRLPAVVVDMGTAVTLDVVTAGGYEGGIIAPGLEVMRSYLHERTAQLPALDVGDEWLPGAIGRSTEAAMRIGTTVGFAGMIQALLDAVLGELSRRGMEGAAVYATGGCAEFVRGRLRQDCVVSPDLTLLGLEAACRAAGKGGAP
ncbi:MAG: type III pantothenate kinase [Opitutaceae bacterium]|jgi:type III pantothenate kinase|nr:type III pantothenate kinase [Opitutaceae bacterium]